MLQNLSLYERRRLATRCEDALRSKGHFQCAGCPIKKELIRAFPSLEDLFVWKVQDVAPIL